jgi:3',5'-cyclic AMP phosphodiesterase CpdA
MSTLAHISDIHLAPLPPVRMRDLLGKRITGYLNWRFHRGRIMGGEGLTNLVRHMREQDPDIVAVTGDLMNLSLDAEINTAYNWLQTVGAPDEVCVTPGNHDAYVPGAVGKARKRWNGYVQGETLDGEPFPFVRRFGELAVVTCSSAISTGPLMASGRFGNRQASRLSRQLKKLGEERMFRVVMIHHPPNPESFTWRLGLWGAPRFRRVVREHGAELILHGHTHKSTIHTIPGPTIEVPVIGVAAAGAAQASQEGEDPARYNLFSIERNGDGWSCLMREYGFQRLGSEIVLRMQTRIY